MNNITTKTNNNKPTCVLCKVPLYKLENEDYLFVCSKDRSHKYQIYAEVMAYDNDFGTILGEEEESQIELAGLEGVSSPVLVCGSYDFKEKEKESKGSIPVPKYMQNTETTKVIYFRED